MLRPVRSGDAEALRALVDANRSYLRRWLPWLDHDRSVADTRSFIETCRKQREERESDVYVLLEGGLICGVCGFNRFDHERAIGYPGYWIAETSRGRGHVGRACLELEGIGADRHGLRSIEIHVATQNSASRRVAEKLGYAAVETLPDAEWLYDHHVDHIVYRKLLTAANA